MVRFESGPRLGPVFSPDQLGRELLNYVDKLGRELLKVW
jgi:hypothetical protein